MGNQEIKNKENTLTNKAEIQQAESIGAQLLYKLGDN